MHKILPPDAPQATVDKTGLQLEFRVAVSYTTGVFLENPLQTKNIV